MRGQGGAHMNTGRAFNPFITFWGYVASTAALGCGLGLGWYLHADGPSQVMRESAMRDSVVFLATEAGPYRAPTVSIASSQLAVENRIPGAKLRDATVYEGRRAYPGAPPRIPHEIPNGLPGFNCLACHEQGGYVARFNAYAPKTPHPEWSQCRQCHVPIRTATLFTANQFLGAPRPKAHAAYPGAPPPIPHDLQYRSNCSACHSGPGAMQEIRTSHPERVGCMQCHVPEQTTEIFVRALAENSPSGAGHD